MSSSTLNHALESVGRRFLRPFVYIFDVFLMIYLSFRSALFDETQSFSSIARVVAVQIYFTGFQALPLISVLALASGSIVILQSASNMTLLGGSSVLGELMVAIVVRELAPLLTALIVIARSGTAVASEIGNMRVNREIEALESMGIHPLSYVVFPRLLGGMISVLCLSIYFVVVASLGGYTVASALHVLPFMFYVDSLARAFTSADLSLFLLKNLVGGATIFMICCYQGFLVKNAPHEVPQVTTTAVVNSVIFVTGFNMTVTVLFYLSRLSQLGVNL